MTGHTVTETKVSELEKEKLLTPGRSVLVNGQVCKDWDEVLKECQKAPEDQPVEVASVLKIQGGCRTV